MLPLVRLFRRVGTIVLLVSCAPVFHGQTERASAAAPIVADELSKGTIPLDGRWQFHLGDDIAWAKPALDDSTGQGGWEQLTTDKPWGMQGHPNTDGYAWYRRRVTLNAGPESPQTLAILLPAVEDAYELYWNGRLVGSYGKLPPRPVYYFDQRPRTFGLGPAASGVLAVRVWKGPFLSFDNGKQGGFYASPVVGSPQAIADALGALNYRWLRGQQFSFALASLYALVSLLSLIAWLRNRSQWVMFWMGCFALNPPTLLLQAPARLPVPMLIGNAISTPFYVLADISFWFLMLWLLDLRDDNELVGLVKVLATVDMADAFLDAISTYCFGSANPGPAQVMDGIFTLVITAMELIPFYLIGLAVLKRKHLAATRWTVAFFAFLTQSIIVCSYGFSQGSRYTGWTLGATISKPLLWVLGSSINAQTISGTLLLVALVYAVYQYSTENSRRQTAMEQEYRNARAVQQVLIPETIPTVPGFAIENVYRPAGEVGGDFFQILALRDGGVLAVIGDVSGKGMPAGMTVSLLARISHRQ
ncbi:MAG TPA: hypothetical protein VG225_04400 [Terracidiphilus sp.]|jgi:hypothetical protein|nr:hypothetical protein [Terracidiphilus sp.]